MPLSPGFRIGACEIVAPIGAGGMGEVYRARDTRLNRDVAIKALPHLFSILPDRAARFEREAQVLASLNHPNIGGIYGLEESGGERYLVLELVPGESLDRRVAGGALPVGEALGIARQIADALAAAHEKGIVHRDLKPGNVMLSPDGHVKVLDFGLAKAFEPEASGSLSDSPTLTSPAMTQAGMIIGTAAYMSPEQARGRPVDRRTDVWAFGCVLYELLTGKRPFAGEDVTETIAAIVRSAPDWSALPPLPPAVDLLLRGCLERDPKRRVADMSTVAFVLDRAETLSGPAPAQLVGRPRSVIRRVLPLVPLLVAIAAIAAFAIWRPVPPAVGDGVTRFIIPLPAGQTLGVTRRAIAISPSGTQIAYATVNQLFVRRLSEFDSQPVPVADPGFNVSSLTFSPDGQSIAFYAADGGIKRVSVAGGAPVAVCGVPLPMSVSWDATGILVGAGAAGILRCNPAGGAPEQVVRARDGELTLSPQLLRDGAIVFTSAKPIRTSDPYANAQIVMQARDGSRTVLVTDAVEPRVTQDGYLLYVTNGILYAAPFSAARRAVTGTAMPLVEGVRRTASGSGTSQFAVSDNGTLVYVAGPVGTLTSPVELGIADRTGTVTRLPVPRGYYTHVRVSPDGARLAIGTEEATAAIVWIYALAGETAMQRLTLQGNNRYPIWSPDGAWIAFQSDRGGDLAIYRQRTDGGAGAERLTKAAAGESQIPESWSPDGRVMSFSVRKDEANSGSTYTLWTLSLPDGRIAPLGGVPSTEPPQSVFSPDGRWVAYAAAKVGGSTLDVDNGVFVQPFPPNGAIYQAPRQLVDFHPVWTSGGKELVFIAASTAGQMAAIPVTTAGGFRFGTPTRFPAAVTGDRLSGQTRVYDVLPDGRFVGMVRDTNGAGGAPSELRVVLNWPAAVRRLR